MDLTLLLTLGLCTPLMWFGAVTEPGLVAALVVSAVLSIVVVTNQPFVARASRVRRVSWAFTALALYQGLTLLPLPPAVLSRLVPNNAAIWRASDLALGTPDRWHPISLDPTHTRFALATLLATTLWFDITSRLCAREDGRRRVLHATAAACAAVALMGLAHIAFGLTILYGVVPIGHVTLPSTGLLTPVLNPNQAAAVMGVAPPVLAGLILGASRDHGFGYKALAGVCCAFTAAMVILTLSRGGMAVLAIETVSLALYAVSRRHNIRSQIRSLFAFGSIVACSAGAVLAVGTEAVAREAGDLDLSKLTLIGRALRMSGESPWFGVGRGAFASTFPAHTGVLSYETLFSHVENWPVQLVVELGWPVTLAFLAVVGHALFSVLPSALARPLTGGALFALLGLAIHDLVDFAMEFAGAGMIATGLLAVVLSAPPATSSQRTLVEDVGPAMPRNRRLRFVAAAMATMLLAVGLLVPGWGHRVQDDIAHLYAAWGKETLTPLAGDIAAGIERHPAEPTFVMLEGVRRMPNADASPYLVHAVRLGPYRGQTHFWLARWFAARQLNGQAWVEYKQAVRLDRHMQGRVLEELARLGAPLEELAPDSLSVDELNLVRQALLVTKREGDAERLDDLFIERYPPAAEARARRVARLVAAKDVDAARREAELAVQLAPNSWEAHSSLASALVAAGEPERAEDALDRGLATCPAHPGLSEQLVKTRGRRLGLAAIERELAAFKSALELHGQDPSQYHMALADVELARRRPLLAIQHLINAAKASPEPTPILRHAVSIAEANSAWTQADALWSRLGDLHPEQVEYRASAQRARQRATLSPSALLGGL